MFVASGRQSDNSSVTIEENVTYASVDGSDLRLDIYKPATHNDRRPAVVLIHGGGWTSFDKSTMHGMGQFLARAGFVGFSVDYRLFQGGENRWPAQLDDVQRAVRWVRANAAKYGVDNGRVGAFGHSAGGQLAALLGMEDTRDNSDTALAKYSSRVQAVVDASGPTDFTIDHDQQTDAFFTRFFGGDYSRHADLWRDASPIYHVAKGDAPFLIVHGTQDAMVAMSQSEELLRKLQAAGVPASLVKVNDGHTFTTPEGRRQLAISAAEFFRQYLS